MPPTRPTRPARRRKKGRGIGVFVFVAVWIGIGIYSSTQKSHHHHSSLADDRSDLIVRPAPSTVAAGHDGAVALRLDNAGPDDLDHNVTFTITAGSGLTITGAGRVTEHGHYSFTPDDCEPLAGGTTMSCRWFVDIPRGSYNVWKIPVHVASGTAPGATLRLGVDAVGNTLYTDPDTSNNTGIRYPVHVSKTGRTPPPSSVAPSSVAPSASTAPSVPSSTATAAQPPSTRPAKPTSTKPHTSVGKRVNDAARDAVGPVIIVAAAVVGLVLLIVIALAVVARRQRRLPLNYVPPRRDRGH